MYIYIYIYIYIFTPSLHIYTPWFAGWRRPALLGRAREVAPHERRAQAAQPHGLRAREAGVAYIQEILLFMGFCARISTIICAPTLCFGPSPPSLHTISQYTVSPRPPVIAIYTTQYWSWQYRVKAKGRYPREEDDDKLVV